MITIQNGKLMIPDSDRFVGFAGDNTVNTKQFTVIDFTEENCTFTLCMRFDDETVRTVPLSSQTDHGNTVLTWEIRKEDLCSSGVVQVQVRTADSDGGIEHTTKDFFLIGSAVELDDDGSEMEYVTPSQLRNSINQALETVTATAPYVDDDGYWCIYDPDRGEYVRTEYHVSGIAPDSAMSDSSNNAVSNRVIKRYVDTKSADGNTFTVSYVDAKAADKVSNTRKIAGLPLTADIKAPDLMAALRPYTYKSNVTPNVGGIKGQIGIGMSGEVFFCNATDHWVRLADYMELNDKMDLVTEVDASEVEDVFDGNMFFCDDVPYVKLNGESIALARSNDVYTKAQIDAMIDEIKDRLAEI